MRAKKVLDFFGWPVLGAPASFFYQVPLLVIFLTKLALDKPGITFPKICQVPKMVSAIAKPGKSSYLF